LFSRFDFAFTLPTIPGTSATFLCGNVKPLPPFALWTALPSSDYYGRLRRHPGFTARSAGLRCRMASHVHGDGLCGVI
jgi:hypothetical protein